jgi:hypothetical protein
MFVLPASAIPESAPVKPKRSSRTESALSPCKEEEEASSPPPFASADPPSPPLEDAAAEPAPPSEEDAASPQEPITLEDAAAAEPPSSPHAASDDDVVVPVVNQTLTLKQLKDLCHARGLPTHGKKSELVARLR